MIIGLTGTKAAGKGVVLDTLKEKGFHYQTLSDLVREEAIRRGLEDYKTKDLQDIGNNLREKYGLGVLVKMALEKVGRKKNIVLDGIRNLGEIHELQKRKNSYIISIDAPLQLRYERLISRGRLSDPKNWEDFLIMNERDLGFSKEYSLNQGQQVAQCMQKADYIFVNNFSTPSEVTYEFTEGEKGFINLIMEETRRPSFGEEFMSKAYHLGHRSTCLRRKVGAVLEKDNRFISDGYNGPARGTPHCKDLGGCLREKLNVPSGERDEICRAIHAEINSILNASTRDERIGASMHTTTSPCTICSKVIANSGIKEITYLFGYNAPESEQILRDAKIKIKPYSGVSPISYHKFWNK